MADNLPAWLRRLRGWLLGLQLLSAVLLVSSQLPNVLDEGQTFFDSNPNPLVPLTGLTRADPTRPPAQFDLGRPELMEPRADLMEPALPVNTQLQSIGGTYVTNQTLRAVNSPYRVTRDIHVEAGVTLTIETGVRLLFDSGVGIKVRGTLYAVGTKWSRILLSPYQQVSSYDGELPGFRLADGPAVSQGRLEVRFRDKWRAVCTKQTNWTRTDFDVTCKSMGFGGGGFWRWFRRNNDTYPLVMPRPGCTPGLANLWDCQGFADEYKIPLTEGLCQGEDDVGISCWGPPSFDGWRRHWKGIEFLTPPYEMVESDPDYVARHKQSLSRLEYVNVEYAGFDGASKNATAAVFASGVPPYINDLRVYRSAGDAVRISEPTGPVLIANSTFSHSRGHGLVISNTTDGRVFVNETRIEHNWGDGLRYRHAVGAQLQAVSIVPQQDVRRKRQTLYFEDELPKWNLCQVHSITKDVIFPYYVEAHLKPGSLIDQALNGQTPCYMNIELPPRLRYVYTFQFIDIKNDNPPIIGSRTYLRICERTGRSDARQCSAQKYRLPIYDGILPQSVTLENNGVPVMIALEHYNSDSTNLVYGQIRVRFKIHATPSGIHGAPLYGLNVTNSYIGDNTGSGIVAFDVRDQTSFSNVTIKANQGYAGIQVKMGAADIWLNASYIEDNWGDGLNVSYSGGAVFVNGTQFLRNRLRGATFHQNTSAPFYAVQQSIIFRGRPSGYTSIRPTTIADNLWGGVIVGNFCRTDLYDIQQQQVLVSYVSFVRNHYHPSFEYHSCRRNDQPITTIKFTGSRCEGCESMCARIAPAVNLHMTMDDNNFMNNSRSALYIRNRQWPQLGHLPATVRILKNSFKYNKGPFIVHIGLNEDARQQSMVFSEQNEIRENEVLNPYPHLSARNNPYAAVVVSSSNVLVTKNCFKNPRAAFEIATDLPEHAKRIDARHNAWGTKEPSELTARVFDQFLRYNLASILLDPYAQTCNSQAPHLTKILRFVRPFKRPDQPNVLGGIVYENSELPRGDYTVVDDLHVIPGARLEIGPGSTLHFNDGIGMLVEGELVRTQYHENNDQVLFTKRTFRVPHVPNMRLVDDEGYDDVTAGRLEVKIGDQWGTVCNRSWTVDLAAKTCHQMGMIVDPEFLENWVVYTNTPGDLPMLMSNIRCEEMEWDLTQCRHDGPSRNVNMSCLPFEVVGVRCVEPHWAGVRYSLLANPPLLTASRTMTHWVIEKAGLFDYAGPEFSSALQIDWNYHNFRHLIIRDNFWNGLDIVYNDLLNKPSFRDCQFIRNRRHGVRIRSAGLSMSDVIISDNQNAGIRYNPIVPARLQRDVVTWLYAPEDSWQSTNVRVIPRMADERVQLEPTGDSSRLFIVARETEFCPLDSPMCTARIRVEASDVQLGLGAYIGVQIVNRPSNVSDENVIIRSNVRQWDLRQTLIDFPLIIDEPAITVQYSRSYGPPQLVILVMFMQRSTYLDRFVHVLRSTISNNAYGLSSLHYSNFTHTQTGDVLIRWSKEKLWLQKCDLHSNRQAVIWVNGPLQDVSRDSPIAQIEYHIDNCSIANNNGSIIETHRDLHSSANVFHWWMWSCTLAGNANSGMSVMLPDTYDLLAEKQHRFVVVESRFERNTNFLFQLAGYTSFVNISSNNFTLNRARPDSGLMVLRGMEKQLVMHRNRWLDNRANWVLKYDMQSQTVKNYGERVPANIRYNYIENNYLVSSPSELIDLWPRSYAIGVFGTQKVDINYNRFSNPLLDFEAVVGVRGVPLKDTMNVSYNFWGTQTEAGTLQRIFDFDDWNIYAVADFNPYYVSRELFIDWWWRPDKGQTSLIHHEEPSPFDLRGRVFKSVTLSLVRGQWPTFPVTYKPAKPYRITRDVTIMPGATLTIEKGVELHVYPNVRILVLGDLVAEGTPWQPIRFKPINTTELRQVTGDNARFRYKRSSAPERLARDVIYAQFPLLNRQDSFYQKFSVHLVDGDSDNDFYSGFLEIYNSTTGEMVPICDRQFTQRNAEVVCRQLGMPTRNAYFWVTPRYDYNPRLRIVKTYSEPRQCLGHEPSLDECDLRLNGDRDQWYCVDTLHFVYVYCQPSRKVSAEYVGNWGGIMFANAQYEHSSGSSGADEPRSRLSYLEVVGAGLAHNDSASALTMIYRTPSLFSVNVTNSSMHGLQIIAPRQQADLKRINITDNNGVGVNVIALNFQGVSTGGSKQPPRQPPIADLSSVPYHLYGLLDMCSAQRTVDVQVRLLVYYKYDSHAADCVKWFQSNKRPIGFRILIANFFDPKNPSNRPDGLSFYRSPDFTRGNYLGRIDYANYERVSQVSSPVSFLGLHLRATAADLRYGFIAEVATLPSAPDAAPVSAISMDESRLERNDRGALFYASAGDSSPELYLSNCYVAHNGRRVWANLTTSEAAVDLLLHNTQEMRVLSSSITHNTGGLRVSAKSTQNVARLQALIKNTVFSNNIVYPALSITGRNYQKIYLISNYFGKNHARYHDTVFVTHVTTNFTNNIFYNNSGLHTVDLTGYPGVRSETMVFLRNQLVDNVAFGHGFHFNQTYGYLPDVSERATAGRVKRQVPPPDAGASFDWWAHVGAESERYRSTVLLGSAQQRLVYNYFSNPLNDFELTTTNKSNHYDPTEVDARDNYWGYPGTAGVAAGKIRDAADYRYLIPVAYQPVIQSNTTLLSSDCPAGWISAGFETFKSCFLFVGGVARYEDAVDFCKAQDAIVPYFRSRDERMQQLADEIDRQQRSNKLDMERYSKYQLNDNLRLWVSAFDIQPGACGTLHTATAKTGVENCERLLPFLCEKGTKPYSEPFIWTASGIAICVLAGLLLCVICCLAAGCYFKSRRRKKEFFERKASLRMSVRSNKLASERQRYADEKLKEYQQRKMIEQEQPYNSTSLVKKPSKPPITSGTEAATRGADSPDPMAEAHRRMVLGESGSSQVTSSTIGLSSQPVTPKNRKSKRHRRNQRGSPTGSLETTTESIGSPSLSSTYQTETSFADTSYFSADTNRIGARSQQQQHNPNFRVSDTPSTPSLSSFTSPKKAPTLPPVNFRSTGSKAAAAGSRVPPGQRGTAASEMSTATYCSTCGRTSVMSGTTSGCSECDRDRQSSSNFSTITEEQDDGASRTVTDSRSTVTSSQRDDDDTSTIYEVPTNGTLKANRPPSFQTATGRETVNINPDLGKRFAQHLDPPVAALPSTSTTGSTPPRMLPARPLQPPPAAPPAKYTIHTTVTHMGPGAPATVSSSQTNLTALAPPQPQLAPTSTSSFGGHPSRSLVDLQYAAANQQSAAWLNNNGYNNNRTQPGLGLNGAPYTETSM